MKRWFAGPFRGMVVAVLAFTCGGAASPIGVAVDATTTVTGSGEGGNRRIVRDSPIYSDDRLQADRTGNAQIILIDETKIVVGPNSDVDIDDFAFSGQNKFSSLTLKATKGTFRFISGSSASAAYRIETPVGSIGVRGTAFEVAIEDVASQDGSIETRANILVNEGEVIACPEDRQDEDECRTIGGGFCAFGVLKRDEVEEEGDLREQPEAQRASFQISEKEDELNAAFMFLGPSCIVQTASVGSNVTAALVTSAFVNVPIIGFDDPASD